MDRQTITFEIPPEQQRTLAECLAVVGCADKLAAIQDDLLQEVRLWRFEYRSQLNSRLHHKRLKSELRRIAKAATTAEAQARWLQCHDDTCTACVVASFDLGDDATLQQCAKHMLGQLVHGMGSGRPEKYWRAPMVHSFDQLWIRAAGNVGGVYEGSTRMAWINALVSCVEGMPIDERHLRALHGQPFVYYPGIPSRAAGMHRPQSHPH